MREKQIELAIIGAGPAGLAAALAAVDSGATEVYLFERYQELGGILPQCIHNGFGLRYFKEELTGPEYAYRFINLVKNSPRIKVKTGAMVVELTPDLKMSTMGLLEGLVSYQAKAVILAMGCRERPRGSINIPGTRPAGIFTAGTIQRMMNIEGNLPGRRAVILGSGDIGLIIARRLTLEGVKVEMVLELMSYSAGLTRNIVQCLNDFKIPLLLNHTVTRIFGEKRVKEIEVTPVDENRTPILKKSFRIDCDTLVLSVGLIPENELSSMAGIELYAATDGPETDSLCQTSIPGIFACGNVLHVHDLVDDVSSEAEIAGKAAAVYIKGAAQPCPTCQIISGRNIRAVTPQKICTNQETTLYIRVAYPERDVRLRVGDQSVKERIVTPGETLRFMLKPKTIPTSDVLLVSIEPGGENHA